MLNYENLQYAEMKLYERLIIDIDCIRSKESLYALTCVMQTVITVDRNDNDSCAIPVRFITSYNNMTKAM